MIIKVLLGSSEQAQNFLVRLIVAYAIQGLYIDGFFFKKVAFSFLKSPLEAITGPKIFSVVCYNSVRRMVKLRIDTLRHEKQTTLTGKKPFLGENRLKRNTFFQKGENRNFREKFGNMLKSSKISVPRWYSEFY